MRVKYKYYVRVVLSKTDERYVTSTDQKFAYWNEGEEAKEMAKATAEDLAFALTINGFPAYIVQAIEVMTSFAFILGLTFTFLVL